MEIDNWEEARAALKDKLAALNAEIGAYPGPITGCDAQFNHMLEERTKLNVELSRLEAAMAMNTGEGAFRKFKESSPYLTG